ncbi:MAG: LLM class flavin-dependent oxidoreductase [Pseudomonadota bacterium]
MHIAVTPWRDTTDGQVNHLTAQAERAEALGFHSFWLPENHFTGPGAIPAPLLLLSAIAAKTERIRLGTTSYLIPIRNPIQVAEEVAVLDRLSGGRVILGLGRGFRSSLFRAFDVPVKEKREIFDAALTLMKKAWQGEPVTWESGDNDQQMPMYLSPLPVQKPYPPLWVAAFGPKAIQQIGRLGLPYLASPVEPFSVLLDNYTRHAEIVAEHGHPPPEAVPIMRTVFVSKDTNLLQRAKDALAEQAARMARSDTAALRRGAGAAIDEWAIIGEPNQVVDIIEQHREQLGMTHLVATRLRMPEVEPGMFEGSLEQMSDLMFD